MNLSTYLREQSYDLIDGPIRNHKALQLWIKKPSDNADLYYEHISHAFLSAIPLNEIMSDAMNINFKKKNDYNYNIGVTVLENILKSLGLGNLEITTKFSGGKKVSISYNNAKSVEYAIGEIENYLSVSDFKYVNPSLLENANKDNILIISGILLARNLVVEIETDSDIKDELVSSLNQTANGKFDFSAYGKTTLKMSSQETGYFPIAVKAYRLIFDKGQFERARLLTDERNLF